ncbi:cytochrome P450 [Dothidotthia symphoricarpi CBS 119687]|uniref:Cytochrome P450 n=1 Tax=Dothidotthia symphoricarpi CBS 119687 TaxID=1392245 RepID=A0A6A6ADJ3_9PLEO|nr:cytochrome P450 [Dothidotthia symphoricarpi CBS 119687]KAF2129626.1 cytochrome P450 [Dothidotthia symphoricarpi CBS 119687]
MPSAYAGPISDLVLLTLYVLGISIYRIFFHPLRRVPVKTYYECFKAPGGQFMWDPNEVHIQDPTVYDTLYCQSRHSDKLKHLKHRFNSETSSFATTEHSVHRVRRGALNPFFSERKITQYSPQVQNHLDRLCNRNESEFVGAFASDIVVGYCPEKPYDFILNPDFRAQFSDAMVDLLDPIYFITQFPWTIKSLKLLPDWLVVLLSPPMWSVMTFNKEMETRIKHAKAAYASGEKNMAIPSLFTALLESDLPPTGLSTKRLQHEAISVIGAGIKTTMYTLSTCSYHLIANPQTLGRLCAELDSAIPDPDHLLDLDTLMQLPYLTNVVNEALRFGYGISQRIPRLSSTPMVYHTPEVDYQLPVGSIVSMDHYTASDDPNLFPDSFAFQPKRWENKAKAPDGKSLTRYLVVFGCGTRSCVGMQLAYADLYIGIVSFFRRFECTLFETERDAVDLYLDSFVPRAKPGTRGVRVHVQRKRRDFQLRIGL